MAAPQITPLSWTTAKQVLGGEASHFTPWLANNLDLLGDVLGIEGLELQGTEHNISGKKLDVLAAVGVEEDGDTVGVAIENQYGMSEHGHLGQLLTYVAGVSAAYDRVLGVWLVDSVHPAHEAAVELLNRETTERLGFVLARPRFISIGPDQYAVDFDVVVRPNEFVKTSQRSSKPENPERTEFLRELIDVARERLLALGYTRLSEPNSGYSFHIFRGNSMWRIDVRATKPDDGFRAMIYVNGFPTTEENEAFLAKLTTHSELIEAELISEHRFNPAAHQGNNLATKCALATCRWPEFGFKSNVDDAANRLLEFARGVAAAATKAGH